MSTRLFARHGEIGKGVDMGRQPSGLDMSLKRQEAKHTICKPEPRLEARSSKKGKREDGKFPAGYDPCRRAKTNSLSPSVFSALQKFGDVCNLLKQICSIVERIM